MNGKSEEMEKPVSTTIFEGSGEMDDEIYETRTFPYMVRYYLKEKKLKQTDVAERAEISSDNLKRYINEKRTPDRNIVIRIAMAMMLELKIANRLLKSLRYADLNRTYKSDSIILDYYDAIIEQFRKSTDPKEDNSKIYDLNQALCEAGCEKLFEGRYL